MPGTHHQLLYHLVFSTKNRHPYLSVEIRPAMWDYLESTVYELNGKLVAVNGWLDHVHLLVRLKTTHRLADFMRELKCNSSKHFNDQHLSVYKIGWQDGYGAFTVGKSQVNRVIRYIHNQEQHHATITFQQEYIHLLDSSDTEYDERYLWD